MGDILPHRPVLLVAAAFSRHPDSLDWARERLTKTWGPIALASDRFDHTETDYYLSTMGPGLKKTFWAFD